jgi:YD repeat-containing protein
MNNRCVPFGFGPTAPPATSWHASIPSASTVINPQGKRTSFSLDGLSRESVQRHANGARTSQVYDPAGQLTGLATIRADPTIVNRFTYTYDQAGHRLGVTEAGGDRTTWTYDRSYQLARELRSGLTAFAVTYAYDPAGNRTLQIDAGVRTTSTYDHANELLVANAAGARTSYSYDNSGNRTQTNAPGGMTFFSWEVVQEIFRTIVFTILWLVLHLALRSWSYGCPSLGHVPQLSDTI